MKKIWIRVVIFLILVWAVSASVSLVVGSRQELPAPVAEKEKPFKLLIDETNIIKSPRVRTEAAIVFDLDSGYVYVKKNEDSVRSIASLTKLATALVFLDTKPDFARIDTVTREDRLGAGRSRLYSNTQATVDDIFHMMLICSDNVAARVIARSSGLTSMEFIRRMNKLAESLDLNHTRFTEPTGLDPGNVSTAAELSILLKAALDKPKIREVMTKKEYVFKPLGKKRAYTIHNTNRLLFGRQDIIGGKTGYICEAGYCLAVGIDKGKGLKLGAILLGSPTSGCRFRDASRLVSSIADTKTTAYLGNGRNDYRP